MKIFRIIARLNVGGPARHVVWLTRELQDEEFASVLVSGSVPPGEEDMTWFARENGVEPVIIPEMSRELSAGDVVSLYKIYRELKRARPDIIHTHTAKAGTVGRTAGFLYRWLTWGTLAGRPRRVRIVHTFHGHVFHSYYGSLKTKLFLAIEKALARVATDRIIVITGQQFDEIHKEFGIGREEQFKVVPLGIDVDRYSEPGGKREILRSELGAGEEIVVGFVGRLTGIKNVGLLLQAARRYGEERLESSPALKFAIIGDGHLRGELEREAEDLGVNGLVTFLGNRNDSDVFYAGLDIVALTSLNEGTPLSLIEAMACGRPVISTAVGGVIDLAGETTEKFDGFRVCERGIIVDPDSPEAFCDALLYLAKNEKLRGKLALAGQTFARTRYNKKRLVDDMKNFYRDLVENGD